MGNGGGGEADRAGGRAGDGALQGQERKVERREQRRVGREQTQGCRQADEG